MSDSDFAVTIDDIHKAAEKIDGQVVRTPLIAAPKLSALTGAEIFVKYENLQFTNSFKDRGALVKLMSLSADERKRGVIAMSAGNHAQAVAYHAGRLGIPAVIVMPEQTPFVKVGNTEALGAKVVLYGDTLDESQLRVEEIIAERDLVLVHPYDDPHVIAGQGTVGLEVLADRQDLDTLVIPIGGGGLIAGSAIAAKAHNTDIEVIGVEAALFPSMYHAVHGGEAKCGGQTLAEGIAVKNAGALTTPIVASLVDDIMLVEEAAIETAVCTFLTVQKTMAEGAGAAGLAAMLTQSKRFQNKKVGLYLCGGNIDPRILASIMIRGLEREDKIISLRITISDQPGVLGTIATTLGEMGANILEVSHRRMFLDVPAKGAELDLLIETKDDAHAREIIGSLKGDNFDVRRLEGPGGREINTR
ncbi:MAG: threonine ammonia-lyase [Hyphomicrobiales bacterium]|nr:threonine ammonia-lyase [Hyphomicrobiales bacterium]